MITFFIFLVLITFFSYDLYIDLAENLPLRHLWHEVILFFIAIAGAVWQLILLLSKDKEMKVIQTELLATRDSYKDWLYKSKNSANEIRKMIDQQFSDWHLSVSEKDVALLLIKGLTMKEIAELRNTQEKTVRQQATTIYRKANLSGRQELAAFFLEDILSTT